MELVEIWATCIALALLVYALADGRSLGVCMALPLLVSNDDRRAAVRHAHSPWLANEVWLFLGLGAMSMAFPDGCGLLFSALFLPFSLAGVALLLRHITLWRYRDGPESTHDVWWRYVVVASLCASVAQGIVLGALVQGVTLENNLYAGGAWDWLTPFSLACGAALAVGYLQLGMAWLIRRTEGDLQAQLYTLCGRCAKSMLVALFAVTLWATLKVPAIAERWITVPQFIILFPMPALVLALAKVLFWGLYHRYELFPYWGTIGLGIASFIGAGVGVFPFVVPYSLTLYDVALDQNTLQAQTWQGVALLGIALVALVRRMWARSSMERESIGPGVRSQN